MFFNMLATLRTALFRCKPKGERIQPIALFNINSERLFAGGRNDLSNGVAFSRCFFTLGITPSRDTKLTKSASRTYASGEYDNLWAAATGGRGVGRGRKKKRIRGIDPELSQFGKEKMNWPGFTTTINLTSDKMNDPVYDKPQHQQDDDRPFRQRRFERGWSGTKWPGRSAGSPLLSNGDLLEDFSSVVIELKRVSVQTGRGKKKQMSATVAVGNKTGAVGWAIGKAQLPIAAIRKARNKAANYLHDVPICDQHTIYHDIKIKHKSIRLAMERKPEGTGLRCQRIVRAICELAGIKDLRCKLVGGSTPQTILRAAMLALKCQETHEELAERTGKNVVEFRAECGNRPVVVATPSQAAVRARIEREAAGYVTSSVEMAFDPARGLHKTKSLVDVQRRNPDM